MYYQRFFPFKRFHSWLSYHSINPQYFSKREFSFAVGEQQDIVVRFASYNNKKEFKEAILNMTPTIPKRIDIGAVYTLPVSFDLEYWRQVLHY
jgi:DNA primase catalytic subunit